MQEKKRRSLFGIHILQDYRSSFCFLSRNTDEHNDRILINNSIIRFLDALLILN